MNWNQALFPSLKRNLSSRRRGGAKRKPDRAQPQEKIGEIFRPESFAELTTPSAALRRLRAFLLMPQPPLLCKEGNVNSFTRSDALGFRHSDDQPRSGDRIDFMCKVLRWRPAN